MFSAFTRASAYLYVWQRRDEAVLVNPCRAFRYRREGLADPGALSVGQLAVGLAVQEGLGVLWGQPAEQRPCGSRPARAPRDHELAGPREVIEAVRRLAGHGLIPFSDG
jgi:hypothetical protein